MASSIQSLSKGQISDFLELLPYSVIHLDAKWDGYRLILEKQMVQAANENQDTSFGYIDVDVCKEHAHSISLKNVPACSYYRGRDLVATVIGTGQNIVTNLSEVRAGRVPDTSNCLSNR